MLSVAAQIAIGKRLVQRLVEEVVNAGDLRVLDEIYTEPMAHAARRWIEPFRRSFPDFRMEIVELLAEGDTVVARFRCSGTHLGEWRGHPPTGRRFERIDEVYFFEVRDGRLARAWGLEDTPSRERQLGLRDERRCRCRRSSTGSRRAPPRQRRRHDRRARRDRDGASVPDTTAAALGAMPHRRGAAWPCRGARRG